MSFDSGLDQDLMQLPGPPTHYPHHGMNNLSYQYTIFCSSLFLPCSSSLQYLDLINNSHFDSRTMSIIQIFQYIVLLANRSEANCS